MTETTVNHPAAAPTPLPSVRAVLWIAWFSLREMARRRRLISLGLINLLPVLVVAVIRIWFPNEGITAQLQLTGLTHEAIIPFLVPIVAMAVGVSAIGEQIEEGTIVYAWTRPIRRRAIYLGRLLAAQVTAAAMLSGSLVLCFLIMVSGRPLDHHLGLPAALPGHLRHHRPGGLRLHGGVRGPGHPLQEARVPGHHLRLRLGEHGGQRAGPGAGAEPALPPAEPGGPAGGRHLGPAGDPGGDPHRGRQREPVPRVQSVAVLLVVGVVATVIGIWLLKHKEIDK